MNQYLCSHCGKPIAEHHIGEREMNLEGCEPVTVIMLSLYCTHCGEYSFVEKPEKEYIVTSECIVHNPFGYNPPDCKECAAHGKCKIEETKEVKK